MKILRSAIIIILASYTILTLYYYFVQKRMIFYPSDIYTPAPEHLKIEEVYIKTSDGEKLHAWWMFNHETAKTVLFFHGNAGNLTDRSFRLDTFNTLGLNCLIIDYRGYGQSSGEINKEEDLYLDGQAAWNYLINDHRQGGAGKKIAPEDIIIWGRSLGGAVAVDLAQNKNVSSVILEASFTTLAGAVPKVFRFLPIRLILQFDFNNGKKITNIKAPVLIIHSQDDEIIPFKQGEKLYQAANQPKQFLQIKGGHNSDVAESYEIYMQGVKDFLEIE